MITSAEAKMAAARIALEYLNAIPRCPTMTPEVAHELDVIEQWLRRRTLGWDKIALRQIEKELGHQVKMRGKVR